MAKTRRTKIIIEETLGENKDTKVFVNGELYQELEDDNNQSKTKKKTTSSKKATSNAKSSTKSKSAKTKKDSNSKTINTKSKNKTTKSSKKTTTKKKSTKTKKNNETKEVKDNNIIELPLLDESKEIENKDSIYNESEKEGTSASFLDEKQEIVEIKDASIVPLNNEISELKSNDDKKEIIENVEIIDPKKEEIIEKAEKKLDVLEAKVIKKEDLEKDNQVNNEEEKAKEKIKEETETIEEAKEQEKESSIAEEKSKGTIKNDDFSFVSEVKEDSTPSKANITVVKENKSQDTKENKSFLTFITSKKGLVIGASLLAILLVVLVPVTLYYQKVNSPFIKLEEIKEEEIDKTKFKTSESFINDLTNLSFDFEDFNNNYLTSFNYSNSNDVYHYENSLTTNYGAATSNKTKETVSFNEETNSYTLTTAILENNIETSKDTKEIKSEEVKDNVRDYLTSFYSDYLYLESTFVKNYLDIAKEKYALKYYYIREKDSYRIMLGDETFVLAFNKYGLVTNMKVGITLPKKVSQTANFTSPIPLYYSIDATYEF